MSYRLKENEGFSEGIKRIVLEQLDEGYIVSTAYTEVRLRRQWEKFFQTKPDLASTPQLVPRRSMP